MKFKDFAYCCGLILFAGMIVQFIRTADRDNRILDDIHGRPGYVSN